MRARCLPLVLFALLALPAASAQAISFGPDLSTATANNIDGCGWLDPGLVYTAGCTWTDPPYDSLETMLPDPFIYGNQTGVVTEIQVLAAATEPAQFIILEDSGYPGADEPYPAGVSAVGPQVTLQPGLNTFYPNLPVESVFHTSGFDSWSVVALNILNGTDPIPAELGGEFTSTGFVVDDVDGNGNPCPGGCPLTTDVVDLTLVPHDLSVGGFVPSTLLMSGDITLTTPAPASTVAPAVTGTPRPAEVLSCSEGTWSSTGQTYSYQWKRDGSPIAGATASTYTVMPADQGHALTCTVTAADVDGSGSATSAAISVPAAKKPPPTTSKPADAALPTVTGTAKNKGKLTASKGRWTGTAPISFSYQWESCKPANACTSIGGATKTTFSIGKKYVGRFLRVIVTATNSAGSARAVSKSVRVS